MTYKLEYSTLSDPKELERLMQITSQCFGGSAEDCQKYFDRIGQENFRVIRRSGTISGGLAIHQMGQWFGGYSVPMVGIAAVGIAPEDRGNSTAYELLKQTLVELQSSRVPISTLYPATQVLYRKLGYEQAGSRCIWELSTASINVRDRDLEMVSVNPAEG